MSVTKKIRDYSLALGFMATAFAAGTPNANAYDAVDARSILGTCHAYIYHIEGIQSIFFYDVTQQICEVSYKARLEMEYPEATQIITYWYQE